MIRDVLIAAINKGQFLTAILGLIALVSVSRMPPDQLAVLWHTVIDKLADYSLAGWVWGGSVTIVWIAHVKSLRRRAGGELDRVSTERNRLQKERLGADVVSSAKNRKS